MGDDPYRLGIAESRCGYGQADDVLFHAKAKRGGKFRWVDVKEDGWIERVEL